jgi:Flp pilus assembly pilin Flp
MKNPAANTPSLDVRSQTGQTMAEYGVMLGLIVLGVAAAVAVLNSAVLSVLGRIATALT